MNMPLPKCSGYPSTALKCKTLDSKCSKKCIFRDFQVSYKALLFLLLRAGRTGRVSRSAPCADPTLAFLAFFTVSSHHVLLKDPLPMPV